VDTASSAAGMAWAGTASVATEWAVTAWAATAWAAPGRCGSTSRSASSCTPSSPCYLLVDTQKAAHEQSKKSK
jgi:hypothetical protein